MQLLAARGIEDGVAEGLGFIDADVERIPASQTLRVPHVGFNMVTFTERAGDLVKDLGERADFYFVHSYRMRCVDENDVAGWCDYGGAFPAIVRRGVVVGAQFHPEKSQSNGLKLLRTFLC